MPEEPIHQPHDKLFKASFGDPVTAAAFLRRELPPDVAEAIDWENLRLEPGSFVDSHFRHSESDLLFSAPMGERKCLVFLLFEHLSSRDPWLGLRLLRYMVRIWEEFLRNHPECDKLPVIIPVVIAQNAEVWQISRDFAELFEVADAARSAVGEFIPDFAFRLVQLAELPFDAIRGTPAGIMTLRVMKAERAAELLSEAVWDEAMLVRLPREIFELLVLYILRGEIDSEAFERKIRSIQNPQIRSTTMSLAEQLLQKGMQKGMEKGLQKGLKEDRGEGVVLGQQKAVLNALALRFGRIPAAVRNSIESVTDDSRLVKLHASAIQAESLDEFRRGL
ncbi:MAG: Rpn family recombination-promoting nuclease/putative transposase [Verrucomicrobiaceae bacterium]|nr:MAG: Rpn family recombination-promoting nuclease/putative transposase [Verrucomicrobiaceae bacterium]